MTLKQTLVELKSSYLHNHLHAIKPKGYQRGSPSKSHQNGNYRYLKQAMQKSCLSIGFEAAAFGLPNPVG